MMCRFDNPALDHKVSAFARTEWLVQTLDSLADKLLHHIRELVYTEAAIFIPYIFRRVRPVPLWKLKKGVTFGV